MLLSLCLIGCSNKQVNDKKVPEYLLEIPKIEYRSVVSDYDASILLIDTFKAYDRCRLQLINIKEFEYGK